MRSYTQQKKIKRLPVFYAALTEDLFQKIKMLRLPASTKYTSIIAIKNVCGKININAILFS
jgi:ABC-type antimicrobial peptide transport system permease subunit